MRKRMAIVAACFYKQEAEAMLKEAKKVAQEKGLTVVREVLVPGCYETPLALKRTLALKGIDGAVVLGVIEKGRTKHGLVMGIVVHSAIVELELKTGKPVGKGILGPEILPNLIPERLKLYARNAVLAVNTMLEARE